MRQFAAGQADNRTYGGGHLCMSCSSRRRTDRLPPPIERYAQQRDRLHRDERAERDRGVGPEAVGKHAAHRLGLGEPPAVPREEEAVEAPEEADRADCEVGGGEGGDPEVSNAPAAKPSRAIMRVRRTTASAANPSSATRWIR